ncbi:MAG: peptidylprolyl isomerase [Acidimicrobiia bacterium]|nr:peptidylprolyl isomerase [Acidimicrobiia bacterium]
MVAVLALVAGACGSDGGSITGPAAATVDGADISEEELFRQLDAIASVEGYGQVFQVPAVEGAAPGTYDTATAAQVLNTLVVFELARQDLAARDVEVDDATRTEIEAQLTQTFADLGEDLVSDVAAGLAAAQTIGSVYAEDDAAPPEVTDEDVRAEYDADPTAYAETCLRLIFVAAETAGSPEEALAEAEDIVAELESGADFETLARERSDDQSAQGGGDLGCNAAGALVPELQQALAEVETGEIGGPIEIGGGAAVVEVYERNDPTFDEIEGEIRSQLEQEAQSQAQAAGQEAFAEWQADIARVADVDIDPRFGSWTRFFIDPATGQPVEIEDGDQPVEYAQIVPPEGPTVPTGGPPSAPVPGLTGSPEG